MLLSVPSFLFLPCFFLFSRLPFLMYDYDYGTTICGSGSDDKDGLLAVLRRGRVRMCCRILSLVFIIHLRLVESSLK